MGSQPSWLCCPEAQACPPSNFTAIQPMLSLGAPFPAKSKGHGPWLELWLELPWVRVLACTPSKCTPE